MDGKIIPKTSLWVGQYDTVVYDVTRYLQSIYCTNNCDICSTCRQIKSKQFYYIYWITSSNDSYLIEDLLVIDQITSYIHDSERPYFFIIPRAEQLSSACANKLLKLFEDAPKGYHFILTTNQEAALLPTVKSRCFVFRSKQELSLVGPILNNEQEMSNVFLSFFSTDQQSDIKTFNIIFEKYKTGCESELLSLYSRLLELLLS